MTTETKAPTEAPPKAKRLRPRPKPPRRVTLDMSDISPYTRAQLEARADCCIKGCRRPRRTENTP